MRSHLGVWIAMLLCGVGLVVMFARLAPGAHIYAFLGAWWPVALIALGLGGALRLLLATRVTLAGPAVLVLLGLLLLLITRNPFPAVVRPYLWPGALVVIGIGMLAAFAMRGSAPTTSAVMRLVSIAESRRIVIKDGELLHGVITAVVSGCILDLSQARLHRTPDDLDPSILLRPAARLEITSVLSGVELVVPNAWEVRRNDSPQPSASLTSSDPSSSTMPVLEVSVLRILGGVRVRRVS